jgi:hypothetical protein
MHKNTTPSWRCFPWDSKRQGGRMKAVEASGTKLFSIFWYLETERFAQWEDRSSGILTSADHLPLPTGAESDGSLRCPAA